jgi:hypothetical protein
MYQLHRQTNIVTVTYSTIICHLRRSTSAWRGRSNISKPNNLSNCLHAEAHHYLSNSHSSSSLLGPASYQITNRNWQGSVLWIRHVSVEKHQCHGGFQVRAILIRPSQSVQWSTVGWQDPPRCQRHVDFISKDLTVKILGRWPVFLVIDQGWRHADVVRGVLWRWRLWWNPIE